MPDAYTFKNARLAKFLNPVADGNPCGPDLWLTEGRYRLQQPLEEAMKPGGQQISWPAMLETAMNSMEQSRDLRVSIVLCLALAHTEKLPGFRDGLTLIRGLLDKFWDKLHPLLEGADDTTRGNTLANLVAPTAALSPYKFLKFLRNAELCKSMAGTSITFAEIEKIKLGDPNIKPAFTKEQVEAAFVHAKESVLAVKALVDDMETQLTEIEKLVNAKMSDAGKTELSELKTLLKKISDELGGVAPNPVPPPAQTGTASVTPPPVAQAVGFSSPASGPGAINSRGDAEAALKAVSVYFREHEPSSAIPLLLDRACKMIDMDFMESMKELFPAEPVAKYQTIFGGKPEVEPKK